MEIEKHKSISLKTSIKKNLFGVLLIFLSSVYWNTFKDEILGLIGIAFGCLILLYISIFNVTEIVIFQNKLVVKYFFRKIEYNMERVVLEYQNNSSFRRPISKVIILKYINKKILKIDFEYNKLDPIEIENAFDD